MKIYVIAKNFTIMKNPDYMIQYLLKMDQLISQGKTGDVKTFASIMNCCERTLLEDINTLRAYVEPFGVDIIYNKRLKTYQYTVPGNFTIIIGFVKQTPSAFPAAL